MRDSGTLRRLLMLAFVTGILFFGATWLSDLAARRSDGLDALFPGNAIILGILIVRGRRWPEFCAILGGGTTAGVVFHLWRHDPMLPTLLFTLANLSESMLAYQLLRRLGRAGDIFDRVNDVLALVAACTVAALASASIGSVGLYMMHDHGFVGSWLSWYASSVLSELVVAPMVVISARLADRRWMRSMETSTLLEVMLVLGLVALVTCTVFLWSTLPLLFLIPPAVLVATFRLRAFGAVGAVAIVAVTAAYATAIGHGPIVLTLATGPEQSMLLQLFLACCFLTALPVAAMLTERDRKSEEARLLADRLKGVVENIGEVIFRVDRAGRWAYLNPAWETLSGFPIEQSLGHDWLTGVEPAERAEMTARLGSIIAGEEAPMRRVVRYTTANGPRWIEIFVQRLTGQDGNAVGATGTLRDIDDRKQLEEHVMTAKRRAEQRAREATLLASTDELTGIANRRAFMRQLDRELSGAAEFGWPLALAMFDVDHFKSINDRYGHTVGDRVLQSIAARAGEAIRGGDLLGRLGGEEFGILMPGATAEDAAIVAERLRAAMEMPRPEDAGLPPVTVSIGIAEREDQREPAGLIVAADTALYAAKSAGRNRVRIAA